MDESIANRIAAGEVVERPASVVKELIENALDAGATRIEVSVEDGGKALIRVADDGAGIEGEDDLRLSLSRHATSKIREADDLDAITTLGFRGEALAAIFAVSRVRIETRREADPAGHRLDGQGGVIASVTPLARRRGTTIEVRSLFYNTPARLKFLGTERAENSQITSVVLAQAVARPDVHFTLSVSGQKRFSLPPRDTPLDRIRDVHGGFADFLVATTGESAGIRIVALMTRANSEVRTRGKTLLVLNGRPLTGHSHVLRRVVRQQLGMHAEAIVYVWMEPETVDVNVTPDKSRVRYRQGLEGRLWSLVNRSALEVLAHPDSTARIETSGFRHPTSPAPAGTSFGDRDAPSRIHPPASDLFGEPNPLPAPATSAVVPPAVIPEEPEQILQFANTFLAVALDDGLLLVDQHSAHERILYERLREGYLRRTLETTELLVPATLEVTLAERPVLEEIADFLGRLGFVIEASGPDTFWLRSTPANLGKREPVRVIRELLAEAQARPWRETEDTRGLSRFHDRLLMSAACHAAIKSGKRLGEEEKRRLWKDLQGVDLACHDVHGRPAALLLRLDEVIARFGRGGVSPSR